MQSKFRNALLNGGYQVSASHTEPEAIKTNAPSSVIWDILRCTYLDRRHAEFVVNVLTVGIGWAKTAPNPQAETTPAHAILSQEPQYVTVNSSCSLVSLPSHHSRSFTIRFIANWNTPATGGENRASAQIKYHPNPTAHWGPMSRATGKRRETASPDEEQESERSKRPRTEAQDDDQEATLVSSETSST